MDPEERNGRPTDRDEILELDGRDPLDVENPSEFEIRRRHPEFGNHTHFVLRWLAIHG